MKKIATELNDCYIIEPSVFGDNRGYFSPYFIQKDFDYLLSYSNNINITLGF